MSPASARPRQEAVLGETPNPAAPLKALAEPGTLVVAALPRRGRAVHVNNSVYSEWVEVARVTLIRRMAAVGPDWLGTALARMTLNFLGETTWPGEVQVGGRLLSMGNQSFRSAYAVFQGDRCLATADCISVYFDRRSRSSTPPPPEVREAMEAELRRTHHAR